MLLVPFHFQQALASRTETLKTYFGKRVEETCLLGLPTAVRRIGEVDGWTEGSVFVLNGSLDPEDQILVPRKDAWMNGR
jgi:hypothetical protein